MEEGKQINFLSDYRNLMFHVEPLNRRSSLQEFCIGAMSLSLDETDKKDVLSLLTAEILRSE